jgi:NAD(P)-dependent dehydrogenase (short-subunit alcohol dehydrogenase family)
MAKGVRQGEHSHERGLPAVHGHAHGTGRDRRRRAGVAAVAQYQPIGRMGRPAEIANGIPWLLTDEARFVTGATFTLDGGALA